METTEQNVPAKYEATVDDAEEDKQKVESEAVTTNTCQDSGLGSGQDPAHTPKKATSKSQRSRGQALSPCMTSTPKKKLSHLAGESDYEIISSQVILEDPLMSSIDEPGSLTDHQAESLTSDEDSEDSNSKFHTTKVKARGDASHKDPHMYKLVNDVSNPRISASQSFSETIQQHVIEANAASIKKNLFDIPVSPKLKNRVRERLYTLVNSIEGYSSVDVSCNQQNSVHDVNSVSALGNSLMERYGCALSGIVTSQVKSLQHHQEQLNQEKLSLAVQRKEQETNARISIYHEKLQLMIQMVEELEVRSLKYQAAAREEAEHHQRKMREQEKWHQEELAALRTDCCRKIKEAEAQTRAAQVAADKACEQRISEVLSSTRVKSAALEKEHEAQISDLKSALSRLRAEKRELEASLDNSTSEADRTRLLAGSPLIHGRREAVRDPRNLIDSTTTESSLYEDLLSVDLLKKKFQEEVQFWKKETELLQKKLHEAEVMQRKLINDTFQDLHSKSKIDREVLGMQTAGESEVLKGIVAGLQEKLSQALNENIILKQKLNECQKKEMGLVKDLARKDDEVSSLKAHLKLSEMEVLQGKENLKVQLKECEEHHKQTLVDYQLNMEKETSAAVSAALARHQQKTRHLLADLGACYEVLIRRIQAHSRAQINEYKKAVRCLKERNKAMEKKVG